MSASVTSCKVLLEESVTSSEILLVRVRAQPCPYKTVLQMAKAACNFEPTNLQPSLICPHKSLSRRTFSAFATAAMWVSPPPLLGHTTHIKSAASHLQFAPMAKAIHPKPIAVIPTVADPLSPRKKRVCICLTSRDAYPHLDAEYQALVPQKSPSWWLIAARQ